MCDLQANRPKSISGNLLGAGGRLESEEPPRKFPERYLGLAVAAKVRHRVRVALAFPLVVLPFGVVLPGEAPRGVAGPFARPASGRCRDVRLGLAAAPWSQF